MEPSGSRLVVIVRPAHDANTSYRKFVEETLPETGVPYLTLSIGRVALAGSWRPVILTPDVSRVTKSINIPEFGTLGSPGIQLFYNQ